MRIEPFVQLMVSGNDGARETGYEKKHSQKKTSPPMHHNKGVTPERCFIGMLFFKPLNYTGHQEIKPRYINSYVKRYLWRRRGCRGNLF